MTLRPMDCAEIRDALLSGSAPAGSSVEDHVRACAACAELLRDEGALGRALSIREEPVQGSPELWKSLEGAIAAESGPRAWLRSRATPVRLLVLLMTASAVVAYGGRSVGHAPVEKPAAWLVAFVLAGLACLFILMAPLGRPRPARGVRLALVLGALSLPLGQALFSSASQSSGVAAASFAEQALGCFLYGNFLALPFLFAVWVLERSDRPWLTLLVGVGAVAGLVANIALALHCPNTEPAHIAAGHATIGAALACLGALWAAAGKRQAS